MYLFLLLGVLMGLGSDAHAARVKDIADIYGVRTNTVTGVGLVTGLNRSGDSMRSEATSQALLRQLQNQGITLTLDQLRSRNIALVTVHAEIPTSARPGGKLDVTVSSTGDATSLEGGMLQMTVLFATNRQAYAVATGALVIGGYNVEQGGNISRKNHPTVGRIPFGATVERANEARMALNQQTTLEWMLKKPDFTTANRMAEQINASLNATIAAPIDDGTIQVSIPAEYQGRTVALVALIESVELEVDSPARVLINEKTGTVVMGADVKIAPVAVAHGGLSIEVQREVDVSQPGALSAGQTVGYANDTVTATESDGQLTLVGGATIGELVSALNKMGVKPRDLIQILIAIQQAGALHADLEVY
jgi:flagellar P-ring protein precursor FlgI